MIYITFLPMRCVWVSRLLVYVYLFLNNRIAKAEAIAANVYVHIRLMRFTNGIYLTQKEMR